MYEKRIEVIRHSTHVCVENHVEAWRVGNKARLVLIWTEDWSANMVFLSSVDAKNMDSIKSYQSL